MRLHQRHGTFLTTHGDERPRLPLDRPTPFAACAAAAILLIVAAMVVGVIVIALMTPGPRWPIIGAGLLALWLMTRTGRR